MFAIPPNFLQALNVTSDMESLYIHPLTLPLTQELRQSLRGFLFFGLQLRSDIHRFHTSIGLPPSPTLYAVLKTLLSPSLPFHNHLHLTIRRFICQGILLPVFLVFPKEASRLFLSTRIALTANPMTDSTSTPNIT